MNHRTIDRQRRILIALLATATNKPINEVKDKYLGLMTGDADVISNRVYLAIETAIAQLNGPEVVDDMWPEAKV